MASINITVSDDIQAAFVAAVGGEDPTSAIRNKVIEFISETIRTQAVRDAVDAANVEVSAMPFDTIKVTSK